jgi:hypothetical protein
MEGDGIMKTFIFVLLLAIGAVAQDFSDPTRLVNDQRVNLQPLFQWWSNAVALASTNAGQTNGEMPALPPRPLSAWVRLVSNELTNTGFAWIARVHLQTSPDAPFEEKLVMLRHGPFEEKKRFDLAVTNYAQATESLQVASNAYVAKADRAAALSRKADQYQEMYAFNPWQHWRLGDAADAYREAAIVAHNEAVAIARRMNQLENQRVEQQKTIQGRDMLVVDSFAMPTGETYRGLPVYEMGLRFGR